MGSVRVGKYDYKRNVQPTTDGYTNVLIHTTGPLSPYVMKDEDGIIMENYWQFSKVWTEVKAQRQPLSQYNTSVIRWEHPHEEHVDDTGALTQAYWDWRDKGFANTRWVRYPAGYHDHKKAIGSVVGRVGMQATEDDYEIVGYLEARRRIYIPMYNEIAQQTAMLADLKARVAQGENIQINEVDGPTYADEPPYDRVVNKSLEMDEATLRALLNNPLQAFGHGYCVAALLLDIDLSL